MTLVIRRQRVERQETPNASSEALTNALPVRVEKTGATPKRDLRAEVMALFREAQKGFGFT